MNKVIFLVAGGTGGHVFPAISLAKSLKNTKPFFFLQTRELKNLFLKEKLNYFLISSSRIEKNIFKFPLIFFKIFFFGSLLNIFNYSKKPQNSHWFWWLYINTYNNCSKNFKQKNYNS